MGCRVDAESGISMPMKGGTGFHLHFYVTAGRNGWKKILYHDAGFSDEIHEMPH